MHNNPATFTPLVIRKYYPCNIHQCVFVLFACLLLLQWKFLLLFFSFAAFAAHAHLFSVQFIHDLFHWRDWRVSMYGLWVGSVKPPELIHAFSLDCFLRIKLTGTSVKPPVDSIQPIIQGHSLLSVMGQVTWIAVWSFFLAMNRERVQLELSFRFP